MAYEAGLEKDSTSDMLKKGLAEVQRAMDSDVGNPFGSGGDMGLGKLFSDPGLMAKLEANPKTREMMKDPMFKMKVMQLQAGGKGADLRGMMADPRMLTVMGVASE